MMIHINTRKIVTWLWIALIALNSIAFAAKTYNYLHGHKYDSLVRLVDVTEEANITTWFSVELFFVAAVLLLLIAMAKNAVGDRWARHWAFLAIVFFFLSLDDAAQLHEMTIKPLREALHTSGLLYYAWVLIAIPLCLILGLLYVRFVFDLPRKVRHRFVFAGTVFIGSQVFVEMLSGKYLGVHVGPLPLYPLLTTIEELGKYAGLVVFISALGTYFTTHPDLSAISWIFASSPGTGADNPGPDVSAAANEILPNR